MKLVTSVGTYNSYRIAGVQGRHFVQTRETAGVAKRLVRDSIEAMATTAKAALDKIESKLHTGFLGSIHTSVKAARHAAPGFIESAIPDNHGCCRRPTRGCRRCLVTCALWIMRSMTHRLPRSEVSCRHALPDISYTAWSLLYRCELTKPARPTSPTRPSTERCCKQELSTDKKRTRAFSGHVPSQSPMCRTEQPGNSEASGKPSRPSRRVPPPLRCARPYAGMRAARHQSACSYLVERAKIDKIVSQGVVERCAITARARASRHSRLLRSPASTSSRNKTTSSASNTCT